LSDAEWAWIKCALMLVLFIAIFIGVAIYHEYYHVSEHDKYKYDKFGKYDPEIGKP